MGQDYFRKISIKLLFEPFCRSGLSANKITVLNFLTLGLLSVILFACGKEYIALLVAGLMAMVDYIDGEIAKATTGYTKLGSYLDTSLDWLWLMLFIGAVSYHNNIMPVGYLALIAITWGNWVEFNGKVKLKLFFPFGISHLMVLGILFGKAGWGITCVAIVQMYRAMRLYRRSVWKLYKG